MQFDTVEEYLANLFGQEIYDLTITVREYEEQSLDYGRQTERKAGKVLNLMFTTMENHLNLGLKSLEPTYGDGTITIVDKRFCAGTGGWCSYVYEVKPGDKARDILTLLLLEFGREGK